MKYQIKHKISGKILFEAETKNFKLCVELGVNKKADLRGADLRGADLWGADLGEADLWGADLRGARGIVAVDFYGYSLYIQLQKTKIGCEDRNNKEWLEMDFEIAKKIGCPSKEHNAAYKKLIRAGVATLKLEKGEQPKWKN